MVYLITGSGGREHALAWKLSNSAHVQKIYCMPGNAGTANTPKTHNVENVKVESMVEWALAHQIDRVIVGGEDLLVDGIVDRFLARHIECIGPHKEAAELEGSKSFAKKFMQTYNIRSAVHDVCYSLEEALACIQKRESYPVVVKVDGLAAGKGVFICQSQVESETVLVDIMEKKIFGSAGNKVVIEDYIDGFEVSIISFYDGEKIIPCLSAKDHKKIYEGEKGKNTGGMGVVVPNPFFTDAHYKDFLDHILIPTQQGLTTEQFNFKGIIFFGLMIQHNVCYLLEYNMRFGDPETQTLLPLMQSDIHLHFDSMIKGTLCADDVQWNDGSACCVVVASGGYPDAYETEKEIFIGKDISSQIFIAGARHDTRSTKEDAPIISSGGRVLNIVSCGEDLVQARNLVYEDISKITFENSYYRKDIGL